MSTTWTSASRLIIVDDVDTSIQYTGPWYPDQGSRDSVGNYGPPYESTLHGVNSNASLSYAFNGSQVAVVGCNNIFNSSGVLDPTWDCFVDGISIGATGPFTLQENNRLLCNHPSLVDGPHILTVNVTVLENQTFWFDDIQYLPSASVPLNQAAIMVNSLDSQLHYGTGWEPLGNDSESNDGNMATVAGSIFTFDFIGVSLSWYGHIPVELPFNPSSATYSIDGETPISFLLNGLPANSKSTVYNQKFFETAQLSPKSHTLKVVYEGSNSTPLILDYLIIQNGTSSNTVSSTSTASATSSVSATSATSTPKGSVDFIVGGVIGGLALLVFAILGFFLLHRRQRRDAQEIVSTCTPRPFKYVPLLHLSGTTSKSSSGFFSYSQAPQTAQSGSRVTKGQVQVSHVPSVTDNNRTEPPSTSSGVIAYPTTLRAVPFRVQQTALNLADPSPLPSSSAQPVPLPRNVEREAEALASPQRPGNPSVSVSTQSNDPWLTNANVVLHADSGIRIPSNTTGTSVVDVPPLYTPD